MVVMHCGGGIGFLLHQKCGSSSCLSLLVRVLMTLLLLIHPLKQSITGLFDLGLIINTQTSHLNFTDTGQLCNICDTSIRRDQFILDGSSQTVGTLRLSKANHDGACEKDRTGPNYGYLSNVDTKDAVFCLSDWPCQNKYIKIINFLKSIRIF